MILRESLLEVGKVGRTHGVKGELSCLFTEGGFDIEELGYVVLEMDGIMVPFFIDSCRPKGRESLLLKFDGVDDETKARKFVGLAIYVPKDAVEESDELDLRHFIGFELTDVNKGVVGVIDGVDDSTANLLFVLGEVLVPVSEEWIVEIDEERKRLVMELPEGLLDLFD